MASMTSSTALTWAYPCCVDPGECRHVGEVEKSALRFFPLWPTPLGDSRKEKEDSGRREKERRFPGGGGERGSVKVPRGKMEAEGSLLWGITAEEFEIIEISHHKKGSEDSVLL